MSTNVMDLVDLKIQALNQWHEEKIQLCTGWINDTTKGCDRNIEQGEIYLCAIGENIGGEMISSVGKDRPVLVISGNKINNQSTIIIAPLTKRLKTITRKGKEVPKYRTHYFLFKSKYKFLVYDSAVKVEDIKSVDKIRLTKKVGSIDIADFNQIRNKIIWAIT